MTEQVERNAALARRWFEEVWTRRTQTPFVSSFLQIVSLMAPVKPAAIYVAPRVS